MSNLPKRDIAIVIGDEKASARLIAKARELSSQLGCFVHAVTQREGNIDSCDKTFVGQTLEDKVRVIGENSIRLVLFDLSIGELAARIAHSFQAGLVSPVCDVYVDGNTNGLVYKVKLFDGRLVREVVLTSSPEFAVMDTSFLPEPVDSGFAWADLMQPNP